MSNTTTEVLRRTEAQVLGLVQQLAGEHSLPPAPAVGTLWRQLAEATVQAYRVLAERVGVCGGRAVIMAGSPGSGKGRGVVAVREVLGQEEAERLGVVEDGFVTVDADDVKQVLLGNPVEGLEIDAGLLGRAREYWDGLIAEHAPGVLADGWPLLRGEVATLVHGLSTATAGKARESLVRERFNVKIEGTLKSERKGSILLKELEDAQYEQVAIVAVDASERMCLEGAYRRWVEPRSRDDVSARYTPPEAVASVFEQGKVVSRCVDNARVTHEVARKGGEIESVNLFVAHRGPRPWVEHVDAEGRVRVVSVEKDASVKKVSGIQGFGLGKNARSSVRLPEINC